MKRTGRTFGSGNLLVKRVGPDSLEKLAATGFSLFFNIPGADFTHFVQMARKTATLLPYHLTHGEAMEHLTDFKDIGVKAFFHAAQGSEQQFDVGIVPERKPARQERWKKAMTRLLHFSDSEIEKILSIPPGKMYLLGSPMPAGRARDLVDSLKAGGITARRWQDNSLSVGQIAIHKMERQQMVGIGSLALAQLLSVPRESAAELLQKASRGTTPLYRDIDFHKAESLGKSLREYDIAVEFYFNDPGPVGSLHLMPITTIDEAKALKQWLEKRFNITGKKARNIIVKASRDPIRLKQGIYKAYALGEMRLLEEMGIPHTFEEAPLSWQKMEESPLLPAVTPQPAADGYIPPSEEGREMLDDLTPPDTADLGEADKDDWVDAAEAASTETTRPEDMELDDHTVPDTLGEVMGTHAPADDVQQTDPTDDIPLWELTPAHFTEPAEPTEVAEPEPPTPVVPETPLEADLERIEEADFPGVSSAEDGEIPDTKPRPKWHKWRKKFPRQLLKWENHLKWVYGVTIFILAYFLYSFDKLMDDWQKVVLYWGSFLLLAGAYRIRIFKELPWRMVFTIGAAFLSIKYMYWRTFETLSYTGFFDFLGMSALYLAELHGMTIHLFSMVINIWPFEREKLELDEEDLVDPDLPTVDIFIPTYSEPLEIVKITATAAKQLNYPKDKLNIYILDDGATAAKRSAPGNSNNAWERFYQLRGLADSLGINYLTRESNFRAKAGNINHALMQSEGDLILVLDCDHVPTRDILTKTVPYFLQDDDLYLVQTPHFFINPTPVEKTLEGVSNVSVENDMFFRVIHAGLDFWNASYFCGSAAVLRRKHVMEIDGFLGETITEDAETSLSLHAKGYNSVFVNHPMVCGLSPETFDDYITQRTRWAQGMMQILLLNNALTIKGLNLPQRLCYFNSSFFWLFSLSRFMYYIAPSLFLMFGLMVYNASLSQIIIYALPYVASTTIVMDFFFGTARKPFFSEIYESVQSLFLLPAIISVLLHPTKPKFKVTPKGEQVDQEYLNPLASAFLLVIFINLIAVYIGVVKWFAHPLYRDVILITGGWCLYNLFMAITSLGAFWERKQVRRHHRINTSGAVKATILPDNGTFECEIKDISLAGLSFLGDIPDTVKRLDRVQLDLQDEYGEHFQFTGTLQRVAPMDGRVFCGVEFDQLEENFEHHVRYVYGNSYRWMDIWERKSSFKGTPKLLGFLFLQGVKAFREILPSYAMQILTTVKKWVTGLRRPKKVKT